MCARGGVVETDNVVEVRVEPFEQECLSRKSVREPVTGAKKVEPSGIL